MHQCLGRDTMKLSEVIKGMLTTLGMMLRQPTCDDAAEGQHKLSFLTSLLWHAAIRVGGEIALQRARHQLKELTHLGLTGKEKYHSLCIRLYHHDCSLKNVYGLAPDVLSPFSILSTCCHTMY